MVFKKRLGKRLQRFSYNLEMKTREQDRNNKRTKIERFDWFVERIQTRLAFRWLSERSDEKTSPSGKTNPAVHFLSVFFYFPSQDIIKGADAKNSGEG